MFVADYTSWAQDCEKAFFSQLEQTYHRKKNKFVRIIKKTAPCRNCGNAPDLKILTDKDVILVSKVFFLLNKPSNSLGKGKLINPNFYVI